ncbi:MAG TPA: hypothetical protein ENK31_10085 [Nannocystis exedens]|nr:hypothetical protein [Nannocystis exedens]
MNLRHKERAPHAVYPGKTSTLEIGGLKLTFQTEVSGDPLMITTIVVRKGRTLRTFSQSLTKLQNAEPGRSVASLVEQAHQRVVHRLKLPQEPSKKTPTANSTPPQTAGPSPTKTAQSTQQGAPGSAGQAASLLVIRAVEAFDRLDHQTALNLLEAAESLIPEDPRLRRSIGRLRDLV